MIRDEKKTESLLEGLGEGVGVENIDKYLQQQGVLVDIHIGRLRNKVDLTPSMLGVDSNKSEELTVFFSDYVKTGKLVFIPIKYEKMFQSIETSLRTKKASLSLGYDNKYMTIDTYKEYKEYVSKKEKDYLWVRDEVITLWDSLMDTFKFTLDSSLKEMKALDIATLKKQILNKIPSKEEYEKSFYISTSLKAFPVMENLSLFDDEIDDEIKKSIQKDSINSVYEIMGNILSDAFDTLNRVLAFYNKNGKLTEKQEKSLKDLIPRIKNKNILKNGLVNELIDNLKEMVKSDDDDDVAELCESALAQIYGFANEVDVVVSLDLSKSELSLDELSSIYEAIS